MKVVVITHRSVVDEVYVDGVSVDFEEWDKHFLGEYKEGR
jgi:hypothetical protein